MKRGTSVLEVDGLTVRIGDRPLHRSTTFSVDEGERVALVGPSGSGKSLVASAVVGAVPAGLTTTGRVSIGGLDVTGTPVARRPRRARAAMVFQDSSAALAPFLDVGTQLELALRSSRAERPERRERRERISTVLRSMAFDDPDRIAASYPAALSGGQRQRACIAMALVGGAPLVVADEPTTALDTVSRRVVLTALDAAPTLLLITHEPDVAAAVGARVIDISAVTA